MQHRLRIGVVICVVTLGLIQGGCVKYKPVAAKTPAEKRAAQAPPQSLSEYIRTVLEISRQNTTANDEALAKLHEQKPELAALAVEVEKTGDLGSTRTLADSYLREGALLRAFDLYQALRVKAPEDPAVEVGLARIWDEWRDYDLARQHADRAVALAPQSVQALELQGRILLHRKDTDAALRSFQAALSIDPNNASVLANSGYGHMLRGDWDQAKLHLARSVEVDDSVPEVRNNLGIVYAFLGEREKARDEFLAVSRPAAAFNNLGVAFMSQNQWKEAREELEHALMVDPNYDKARQNLTEVMGHLPPPSIYTIEPFAPKSEGENERERQATSTLPVPAWEPRSPASLGDYMRKVFKMSQENAAAAAEAEMLARANRPSPEIQKLAANIAGNGAAVPRQAVSDPFQFYKKMRVSMVEARPNRVPWLLAELRKELPTQPTQTEWEPFIPGDRAFQSLELAATADMPKTQLDRPLADFTPAVPRLTPSDPMVLASRGHELMLQAKWEEAREALNQALEADDSIAEAHNDLGIALAYLGDREGALEHFEAVNDTAVALANLGSVYTTMKDWKQAQASFEAALAIDPDFSKARAALREVESYLPPPTQYVIQVFSDKNPRRSESQKAQLAKAGLKPEIEPTDIQDRGRWYRVRLYGYQSMKAALGAAKKMLQEGVIGDFWVVKESPKG